MLSLKRICCLAVLLVMLFTSRDASAQSLEFIRDAEIENTIRMYATPLFRQAGVDPAAVDIHLVKDPQLNAFVAEGLNLFLNTGLIIRTDHAGQLIGVIAHECGHIAGGHLVKGQDAIANAMTEGLAAMVLGMAAVIAASHSDQSAINHGYAVPDNTGAAMGAVLMGSEDVAMKSYAAFSRTIEGSADTAALTFLDNLHMSARGFLEFMELLGDQELLVTSRQDPYVRTHPLTRDRIDEIRHHVENSPWSDVPVPPQFAEPHQRMRAKLAAFLQPPSSTLFQYKESDHSIAARYARAIAYYRIPDLDHALPLIDGLIAERPEDPYFHELKGQILFENGRPAEAIPEYKLSVQYLSDNALLREELGQVEVEAEDPAQLADAKEQLVFATRRDPENAEAWRLLATAYGRGGDEVMAAGSMAEYALLVGRYAEAVHDANKALKGLKPGTPAAIRMEDVRNQAEQGRAAEKKRSN